MHKDKSSPLNPDAVWTVKNIGNVIGRSERETRHLIDIGALPVKQIGRLYVASRKKLLEAAGLTEGGE